MEGGVNYLSPSQFEDAIHHIPELKIRKWYDIDVEYLFRNLYWMGLRPVEGIRLKKEDFNLSQSQVFLGKTKTVKFDFAPIPPPYLKELTKYLYRKEKGRLLEDLTYHTFLQWVNRLGKICDIVAWTTPKSVSGEMTKGHLFRKSIGKDMLYGNVKGMEGIKFEIPLISKQLRHASPSTTLNSYLKADLETVKRAWTDLYSISEKKSSTS